MTTFLSLKCFYPLYLPVLLAHTSTTFLSITMWLAGLAFTLAQLEGCPKHCSGGLRSLSQVSPAVKYECLRVPYCEGCHVRDCFGHLGGSQGASRTATSNAKGTMWCQGYYDMVSHTQASTLILDLSLWPQFLKI